MCIYVQNREENKSGVAETWCDLVKEKEQPLGGFLDLSPE